MRLLSPSSDSSCIPMRIVAERDELGPRLGGTPPQGVRPPNTGGPLRYFATVSLAIQPDQHLSIFVADFERIADARGAVNEPGLLEIVTHTPARRDGRTDVDSQLSAHDLVLLPETADVIREEDGNEVILSGHKIGGRPHLVRQNRKLLDGLRVIGDEGFRHVAQFDFPERDDAIVSGSWPFGDGIFSLFGRAPFGRADWRWCWDF
jgi:hypothetical protein